MLMAFYHLFSSFLLFFILLIQNNSRKLERGSVDVMLLCYDSNCKALRGIGLPDV